MRLMHVVVRQLLTVRLVAEEANSPTIIEVGCRSRESFGPDAFEHVWAHGHDKSWKQRRKQKGKAWAKDKRSRTLSQQAPGGLPNASSKHCDMPIHINKGGGSSAWTSDPFENAQGPRGPRTRMRQVCMGLSE